MNQASLHPSPSLTHTHTWRHDWFSPVIPPTLAVSMLTDLSHWIGVGAKSKDCGFRHPEVLNEAAEGADVVPAPVSDGINHQLITESRRSVMKASAVMEFDSWNMLCSVPMQSAEDESRAAKYIVIPHLVYSYDKLRPGGNRRINN